MTVELDNFSGLDFYSYEGFITQENTEVDKTDHKTRKVFSSIIHIAEVIEKIVDIVENNDYYQKGKDTVHN